MPWGLPKDLLLVLPSVWWGQAAQAGSRGLCPQNHGSLSTLGELISCHPSDRCFWGHKICGSGECEFLDYSPILYGDRMVSAFQTLPDGSALLRERCLSAKDTSAVWQLLQNEILERWGMALRRGLCL